MYPGRLDEQPMPLIVSTSCGYSSELDDRLFQRVQHAEVAAARAPVGIRVAFEVLDRYAGPQAAVDPSSRFSPHIDWIYAHSLHSLNHDLVDAARYCFVQFSCARQNLLDAVDDVVRHERLAIVLANVAVGDEAGLGAQIARELAAVVVLDDDHASCTWKRSP